MSGGKSLRSADNKIRAYFMRVINMAFAKDGKQDIFLICGIQIKDVDAHKRVKFCRVTNKRCIARARNFSPHNKNINVIIFTTNGLFCDQMPIFM